MKRILIEDLEVYAYHGVFEEEKKLGQKFYISLEIVLSSNNTYVEDKIESTIHYGEVCETVSTFFINNSYDLIEKAAFETGLNLFENYKSIESLKILVKKPSAPIKNPLSSVSVEIEMFYKKAYVSIGGNIGNSNEYFDKAVDMINGLEGVFKVKESSRIITKPHGEVEQADFLNSIVEIETILGPNDLLHKLQNIELELGRVREVKWGPRVIDLDIILFGQDIISDYELIIPHPFMEDRKFVLEPLCELNENLLHPYKNKLVKELLKDLKRKE